MFGTTSPNNSCSSAVALSCWVVPLCQFVECQHKSVIKMSQAKKAYGGGEGREREGVYDKASVMKGKTVLLSKGSL